MALSGEKESFPRQRVDLNKALKLPQLVKSGEFNFRKSSGTR